MDDLLRAYCAQNELRPDTQDKLRHRLNCWVRHGGKQAAPLLGPHFDAFRAAALAAGLSRRTIEETVRDVGRIADAEDLGRSLRGWKSAGCREVPSIDVLSTAYQAADAAQWPNGPNMRTPSLMRVDAADWWRAFLVFAFFTGLRLRDLRTVTWSEWDRGRWEASKTSKVHQFPECQIVDRHLQPLRVSGSARIFDVSKSQERLLRRELKRLSCDRIDGSQAIRRCSITSWSIASPDAGRLIHGVDLGVIRHYLDVRRVLAAALPRLQWPAAFLSEAERDQKAQVTERIVGLAGRLPVERLDDLERVAMAFAG